MRFKTSLKYYLTDVSKGLLVYYSIVYGLIVVMLVLNVILNPHARGMVSGFETASMIFIFIVGLNSFKSNFKMLLANGVSRVTMFKSTVAGLLPVAGFMALLDSINSVILSSLVPYKSFFMQLYQTRYAAMPAMFGTQLSAVLEGFLWLFFTYAMLAMAGFIITTLYYRMNKAIKLSVSIGVPVFLLIVLPFADGILFRGAVFRFIGEAIRFAWGLGNDIPYMGMLTGAVLFAVLGLLNFLAMRRAQIKE